MTWFASGIATAKFFHQLLSHRKIARMIAAGANTSLLVVLLALQGHQLFLVTGFQAPAARNGRRIAASSVIEMAQGQQDEQQRKSVLGGRTTVVTTTTAEAMDHTPVVPQDTLFSSSSMQIATNSKDDGLDKKDAADDANKEEEKDPTKKMLQQIKDSGLAGVISYALWELGFWSVSIPLTIIAYQEVTGHWPDLQNPDDIAKLSAEAFAFVNFARFAVPLRIGTCYSHS
jgi:hypothetical protein